MSTIIISLLIVVVIIPIIIILCPFLPPFPHPLPSPPSPLLILLPLEMLRHFNLMKKYFCIT